jgi:SAM-dependent methyltransferase
MSEPYTEEPSPRAAPITVAGVLPESARESSTRGAIALLAPVHGEALSLVVGSGQGGLLRAISTLGGRAVGIGPDVHSLLHAHGPPGTGSLTHVCADPFLPLPFASASMDNVFLCARFSDAKRAPGPGRGASGTLGALLEECHRVLKPGGTLVLEGSNRLSFLNWVGKCRDGAAGGRLELLPRILARTIASVLRDTRAIGHTRILWEYSRHLPRAGFHRPEVYVPWPYLREWYRLWPLSRVEETPLPFDGRRRRDRLAGRIFAILQRLRLQRWLVPGYVFVARKPTAKAGNGPLSVVDLVLNGGRYAHDDQPVLRAYENSGSVIFHHGDRVLKVPLTKGSQDRLWREREALARVSAHPIAPLVIRPLAYRTVGRLRWAVYPHAGHDAGGEDGLHIAREVLGRLLRAAAMRPLHSTDAWRRFCDPRSLRALGEIGADALLREIEWSTADLAAPVGLVHGDLCFHNFLTGDAGGVVVIDWDRSERRSPVFLDVLAASHFHAFRYLLNGGWDLDSRWAGWQLLFDQDSRLALRPELEQSRGELGWSAMVAFGVLNTIQWDVLTEGSAAHQKLPAYRRWAEECRRRVRLAAAELL